ncbi:MAG: prolipoprotein diacylglyceryl transferase [Anaerolineae bacterium]
MLPILELGPWQVSTYFVTATLGLLVAGMWAFHRLLTLDHPPGIIVQGFALTALGGLAGALLIPYLINAVRVARSPVPVPSEGLSIIWALGSCITVAVAYCRWRQISLGRALDLAILPMPLGQAIGRLGCFAAACCYGRPTDSWLGMYLPDHDGVWLVRYPTQLLSAAANLFIFFVLLTVERRGIRRVGKDRGWPFDGFLILLYLALFSLKRFAVAFLRESGAVPWPGPLSWMHVNALLGLAVSGTLICWNLVKERRQ